MPCIPFGATAAIHGFNRVAIALQTIITKIFGIPCAHYFDDFTFIVPSTLGQELIEIVKEGLVFLGWRVKGGSKDVPLDRTFGALGVIFDLSQVLAKKPFLFVSNKPGRAEAIRKSINEVLDAGKIAGVVAQRIRGKPVFSRAQFFGRVGAMAPHLLEDVTLLGSQEARFDRAIRFALSFWHDFLKDPIPRTVPLSPHRRQLVLLTDGCCVEKGGEIFAGFGGVMIDPENEACEFFQGKVDGEFLQILTHTEARSFRLWGRQK